MQPTCRPYFSIHHTEFIYHAFLNLSSHFCLILLVRQLVRSVQVFFCFIFRVYFCVLDVHLPRLFSLILSRLCHICNIFQCPFISFLSVPKVLFSSSFLFRITIIDGETKFHIRTKQRMKLLFCTYISFFMNLDARRGDKTF